MEIRSWYNEVILPADKGDTTVVMERGDYDRKIKELLDDTFTYHKLPNDPTRTQDSKISIESLDNGKEIMVKLYNRLRTQPHRIYGLSMPRL